MEYVRRTVPDTESGEGLSGIDKNHCRKPGIEYGISPFTMPVIRLHFQTERVKKLLTGQCFDYVTFTSGSTVRGVYGNAEAVRYEML